jgi:acyl carrier protein
MTKDDIRAAFIADLTAVAPDLDPATLDDDDHLQDDLGLDSMDFLNLVSALHKRFRLPIPETDYPRLATPAKAVTYLQEALAA